MDKNSKPNIPATLNHLHQQIKITEGAKKAIGSLYESFQKSVDPNFNIDLLFEIFIERVVKQCENPYPFQPFHQSVRAPFDYYTFGLEFLRPLIIKEKSTIQGEEKLSVIEEQLKKKDNVVFFANHQIEADPIVISLLLEDNHPTLAHQMIFVAGERVLTDPTAVPFSLGCNLLCIYSKRYIEHPPEKKLEKQLHNKKTMQLMSNLLKVGGKCIYVAPSGGRDRKNANGIVEVAPFDGQSIEMFHLMAKKSKTPTHFYPMTLDTYEILPPPETIQVELGEIRYAKRAPIHLGIGSEIDMNHYPGSENSDKHLRRKSRADYIWKLVENQYHQFPKD